MIIIASRLLPIGNVQAILACNGLFVVGWMVLVGAESLHRTVLASTMLCVIGAVLSSAPTLNYSSMVGYAAAWAASICWAAEIIVFRYAVVKSPGKPSLLVINLIGVALLAVPGTIRWRHINEVELCVLILVGTLLVISQAASINALKRIPLSSTIPFRYLNVPIAIFLGMGVLHQLPSVQAIIGSVLIICGGIVISRQLFVAAR